MTRYIYRGLARRNAPPATWRGYRSLRLSIAARTAGGPSAESVGAVGRASQPRGVMRDLQCVGADHDQRRHDHDDGEGAGNLLLAAAPAHGGISLVLPVPATVLGPNDDPFVTRMPQAMT